MTERSFKRREGLSLQKLKAYEVTKNISDSIRKEQQDAIKQSMKNIKGINNLSKQGKYLTCVVKTYQHSKHQSQIKDYNQFAEKKKNLSRSQSKKFKLLLNNPISKADQNIQHLVQQIIPKAKGFYRFGMKSYQKTAHKRVFSDVLNIAPQNMKGLIFVGELWSNNMNNKFLKSNKVNINKTKFFQKLKDLKWQRIKKQRQKQLDSSNLINSVRQFSQKSLKSIQTIPHIQSLLSLKHFGSTIQSDHITEQPSKYSPTHQQNQKVLTNFTQVLSNIRNQITSEYKKSKDEQYWKDMKSLQSQGRQMHKLWDKYFSKMLQI